MAMQRSVQVWLILRQRLWPDGQAHTSIITLTYGLLGKSRTGG
jgi:hypothetical protein